MQEQVEKLKEKLIKTSDRNNQKIKEQTYILTPVINDKYCNNCGRCIEVCSYGAISMNDSIKIDRELCVGCGICVAECPKGAIALEKNNI